MEYFHVSNYLLCIFALVDFFDDKLPFKIQFFYTRLKKISLAIQSNLKINVHSSLASPPLQSVFTVLRRIFTISGVCGQCNNN